MLVKCLISGTYDAEMDSINTFIKCNTKFLLDFNDSRVNF